MASEFCLTPTDRKKVFARPRPPNWKRAYSARVRTNRAALVNLRDEAPGQSEIIAARVNGATAERSGE